MSCRHDVVPVLIASAIAICGGALSISACSDDADAPGGASSSSGGSSSGGSSSGGSSSGGSSSGGSSSGGSSSGGSSGTPGDAGKLANGATCTAQSDTSLECESGVCKTQGSSGGGGGGGGTMKTVCTIKCMPPGADNQADCVALGEAFTGKCTGQGYCQAR